MTVLIQMRDQLDVVRVEGTFEKLAYEMNMQMQQGKKLIAVQQPDGMPIGFNLDNVNTIRPESMEDAFSSTMP